MLNGLALFEGIGGITLALKPWVRPLAYCEIDRYAQAVLFSRMARNEIYYGPVWPDIRTLTGEVCPPAIDIITGGFPCQDISAAGNGAGLEGERSGLFFEIIRLCRDIRPRFVFLENVPAITTRGGVRVISEFAALGYDCRWTIVSAAEVGAPHLRERWWLLAHSNGERGRIKQVCKPECESSTVAIDNGAKKYVSDSSGAGSQGWMQPESAWQALRQLTGSDTQEWPQGIPQPSLSRGHDGLQNRVDRIRGLGNAVVPLAAQTAFKRLMGLDGRSYPQS